MNRPPLRWAYGVTSVPQRFNDLLPKTLESLAHAGFEAPRLFLDGCREHQIPLHLQHLEVTCRFPGVLAYGNWILALAELLIRNHECDRFALFQDDFVTYKNLRKYLDQVAYPDKGYCNLFTVPQNYELAPLGPNGVPKTGWFPSNQYGRGAVATVFSREAVIHLLTHQADPDQRGQGASHLVQKAASTGKRRYVSIDGGLITAMTNIGWKEYCHVPSLVQHTGLASSMGNRKHPQADSFKGEHFDALEMLQ